MRYWLMKSEPDECSIDMLSQRPDGRVPWTGVRNYQARNFMRDAMEIGDLAFFYHSSCAEPGIAGIVRVASGPYPDATQFDPHSPYFDPRSREDAPRWVHVDVELLEKTPFVGLPALRGAPQLENMRVLARGNRLSITPVEASEWRFVTRELMGLKNEF